MLCTLAALGLAAPATYAAPAAGDDTTVATVNGEVITLGEMRALAANIGPQAAELPATALWDMVLDQITRQVAVAQQSEGKLSPQDKAGLALQRRAYLASVALEKIAAPEPTEAELRAAYDKIYGKAGEVTEYNASHILVETEEAAKAVEADLAAGKEFGAVAEARSTGPSGPNKGDLGWFTLDMMVKPFADAVAKLKKGDVSAPVQTQFGWHVIKLNDERIKTAPKFEEVTAELAQAVRRERVDADIARVLGEAKVDKVEGLSPDLLKEAQ
ncbi:peptidylprolyl isomerase [Paracoccus suum]|uniref:Parvulin-like PPIase n=2 Tax=Paracoccus suum TaxID=2259340 RepID=A0A344PNN4_9RHOB|nr:peptidylprolyl isomerase [Paracoccus suum]